MKPIFRKLVKFCMGARYSEYSANTFLHKYLVNFGSSAPRPDYLKGYNICLTNIWVAGFRVALTISCLAISIV